MTFTVTSELIAKTSHPDFQSERDAAKARGREHDIDIDISSVAENALKDLAQAAASLKEGGIERAIESILTARTGNFSKPVPSIKAFEGILQAFLQQDLIDGWVYVKHRDGYYYPELVTALQFDDGRRRAYGSGKPELIIRTAYYGRALDTRRGTLVGVQTSIHTFEPKDVVRRSVAEILSVVDMYKETPALKADYKAAMERHRRVTQHAFTEQFRASGVPCFFEDEDYRRRSFRLENRRVVHDLAPSDYGASSNHVESTLFRTDDGAGAVPEHPVIRLFDLKQHEFFWTHSAALTPYEYDHSLREKLILPETHRDLLDVLTSNLDAFVEDIIEGKSAGNVILCKGIPGVGKTLTAEVYSELIGRPLYSIHSGTLGTDVAAIEQSLKLIFERAKRWSCPILLDECDVYVGKRGGNIEQNAIVAEFLRTLEYFDGLLFMTTNRVDDIDDAIVSRCAAIIDYAPPSAADAAAIWRVMAKQYKVELGTVLIASLVTMFPEIAPRDIKMLLRLALRVAKGAGKPLTIDTFRRCAMFRAIKIATSENTLL